MPSLGETKRVWNVVGPGSNGIAGAWWCQDDEAIADKLVAANPRWQKSPGIAMYAETEEGMTFWDVRRPVYRYTGRNR